MAVCDECCCFDDNHVDNEGLTDEQLENNINYEPNRYFYWHGDIQEDYQMPKGYDCLCDKCFGDFLNTGEIFEKYLDNGQINPIWDNDKHGWFTPVCNKTS